MDKSLANTSKYAFLMAVISIVLFVILFMRQPSSMISSGFFGMDFFAGSICGIISGIIGLKSKRSVLGKVCMVYSALVVLYILLLVIVVPVV